MLPTEKFALHQHKFCLRSPALRWRIERYRNRVEAGYDRFVKARGMRGPQGRGSPRERAVAAVLRDLDYLVGSLRHTGGAGDLLAHHRQKRGLLVEVKATTDLPWRSSLRARQARRDDRGRGLLRGRADPGLVAASAGAGMDAGCGLASVIA